MFSVSLPDIFLGIVKLLAIGFILGTGIVMAQKIFTKK